MTHMFTPEEEISSPEIMRVTTHQAISIFPSLRVCMRTAQENACVQPRRTLAYGFGCGVWGLGMHLHNTTYWWGGGGGSIG